MSPCFDKDAKRQKYTSTHLTTTHYLADQIETYFAQKIDLKSKVSFNREEKLLGTAGGLKHVHDHLGFFSGDDLTSVDLTAMLAAHREHNALATIALTEVEAPSSSASWCYAKTTRSSASSKSQAPNPAQPPPSL